MKTIKIILLFLSVFIVPTAFADYASDCTDFVRARASINVPLSMSKGANANPVNRDVRNAITSWTRENCTESSFQEESFSSGLLTTCRTACMDATEHMKNRYRVQCRQECQTFHEQFLADRNFFRQNISADPRRNKCSRPLNTEEEGSGGIQ